MPYQRHNVSVIKERINEQRRFFQIVIGPRQTGKTTAVSQALESFKHPFLSVIATKGESNADWLRAQWYQARQLASSGPALLVIDEVQFVPNWSSVVKTLWDEDALAGFDLRVLLTGSSATLIQKGLDESLAGRFEQSRCARLGRGRAGVPPGGFSRGAHRFVRVMQSGQYRVQLASSGCLNYLPRVKSSPHDQNKSLTW